MNNYFDIAMIELQSFSSASSTNGLVLFNVAKEIDKRRCLWFAFFFFFFILFLRRGCDGVMDFGGVEVRSFPPRASNRL